MAHRIEQMPLDELMTRTHPKNPKRHDVTQLVRSLERFGFTQPVLLDERTGKIAAGHGRVEALSLMRSDEDAAPEGITVKRDAGWAVPVVRGW